MRCESFRKQIHEFMDGELPPRELSGMEEHRLRCSVCRQEINEMTLIRDVLRSRATLPEAAATAINGRILRETTRRSRVVEALDWLRTYWRDLDRRLVWSKVSAVPVTLCFFAVLLVHFSPARLEGLETLVFASQQSEVMGVPFVRIVRMRQNTEDLQVLMEVSWRLPFEDSAAVVAEIRPDGYARIDSVLEYPRSYAFFNAVNGTLRRSRFDRAREMENAVVIFSFQKIDVYEEPQRPGPEGT